MKLEHATNHQAQSNTAPSDVSTAKHGATRSCVSDADAEAGPTTNEGPSDSETSTTATTKSNGGATSAPKGTPTPPKLKSRSHRELKELVKNAPGDLVQELVPEKSVNILVGDSGLGKTPLLAQLGLCFANGIPFLGQTTRRGVAIYVDYENGASGFDIVLDKLNASLGLAETPNTFRHLHQPSLPSEVESEIKAMRALHPNLPIVMLIDALRGFDHKAETKNEAAAAMIAKLEQWANRYDCAFLMIHHIRKDNPEQKPPKLSATDIMEWLLRASGARSLINQTMVRFGIDTNSLAGSELIIKGHYKLRGAIGPLHIGRTYDEDGDPTGYQRLTGIKLLSPEQQTVFAQLPDPFTNKQLGETSKRNPKIVADWLRNWRAAGVIRKTGEHKQTRYRKLVDAPQAKKAQGIGAPIDRLKQQEKQAWKAKQEIDRRFAALADRVKVGDVLSFAQLAKELGVDPARVEDQFDFGVSGVCTRKGVGYTSDGNGGVRVTSVPVQTVRPGYDPAKVKTA